MIADMIQHTRLRSPALRFSYVLQLLFTRTHSQLLRVSRRLSSESPAKRSGWTLEGGTGSEEKHFVYWKQLRRGGNVFFLCVFKVEQAPSRLPPKVGIMEPILEKMLLNVQNLCVGPSLIIYRAIYVYFGILVFSWTPVSMSWISHGSVICRSLPTVSSTLLKSVFFIMLQQIFENTFIRFELFKVTVTLLQHNYRGHYISGTPQGNPWAAQGWPD